ncbi:FecR family protein [Flagellimonas onchidii]|uniref:FecR family protein n=1 Tax=Flagellimonas onchidii TaxID=2562684 RepID=UPI0010A66DDB|nr:FecR domain-containing protein [Allomuricauda onchidii]
MDENQNVIALFKRFIRNTISKSDFNRFFGLFEKPDSEDKIKDLMNEHWEKINSEAENAPQYSFKNTELLEDTLEKINRKEPRKLVPRVYMMAASLALLFSIGYLYFVNQINTSGEPTLNLVDEKIILQLGNGDTKIVSEEEGQIIGTNGLVVGTHTSNGIVYGNDVSAEKLEFNTLMVPYGKRFQVALSDGTKVHLNAGTTLRYPVKFISGLNREVYLDGEAYFDVVKDRGHPFLVNSNNLSVNVLGTKFNVKAYPENEHISTVLAEGSVEVLHNETPSALLEPGHMATWHKSSKSMTVEEVDIEPYLAWMQGRLILNEVAFEVILKRLERQYNVEIINNNPDLYGRYFTAKFDVEDINQVMESLSISASFSYTLKDTQIIINP